VDYPSLGKDVGTSRFCSQCGYRLQGGEKYCIMCGWEVQNLSGKTPQDIRVGTDEVGLMPNYEEKNSHMSKKYDIIQVVVAIISIFLYVVGFGIHVCTFSLALRARQESFL
jgi:uncharacterized membrane protein YvbJ